MSNRAKAREFAHRFADLAIECRHGNSDRQNDKFLEAQELYDQMIQEGHDFSTTEMYINDLLWELNIIPCPNDPLYEAQRTNSQWSGTSHSAWKKVLQLEVGDVIETIVGQTALILVRTSDNLVWLNLNDKGRCTIPRFRCSAVRLKLIKHISRTMVDKICKGDVSSLEKLRMR